MPTANSHFGHDHTAASRLLSPSFHGGLVIELFNTALTNSYLTLKPTLVLGTPYLSLQGRKVNSSQQLTTIVCTMIMSTGVGAVMILQEGLYVP